MTFQEIAIRMCPMWILGAIVLFSVYKSSHKDLLRIEKPAIKQWFTVLGNVTIFRIVLLYFIRDYAIIKSMTSGALTIPWQATFTVFWEDACHGLPLVLLARYLTGSKYEKWANRIALSAVMVYFGLGHAYQGWFAILITSLYIPFSVHAGKKYGFGTVIICHMMYDLITILTLKSILG